MVRVSGQGKKLGQLEFMTKNSSLTPGEKPARSNQSSADMLGSNSEIARKLKQYHDELLSLDVPDRFAELLTRLEKAEMETRLTRAEKSKAEG
jgi:hypothetical protein